MELDLWVRARKQGGAWEIVKQQVITPKKPQTQTQHLAALSAETKRRGIPQLAVYLDADVETGRTDNN